MAKILEQTENTVKENLAKDQIIPFKKNDAVSVYEKINDFIQNNRKRLVIGTLSILVLVACFIAALSIRDAVQSKAISRVEDFSRRYDTLRFDITEPSKEEEVNTLVAELSAFAPKHAGYVGARSYSILAGIYADKKAWEDAENAWTNAAKAGAKTYLAAVSLFNAAVAAEEQGNIPRAIELYTQSVALADVFPAASRAQFSIGRLQEEQHNKDAALEAYRQLVNKWPQDTAWTNWAQSRIIMLTAR